MFSIKVAQADLPKRLKKKLKHCHHRNTNNMKTEAKSRKLLFKTQENIAYLILSDSHISDSPSAHLISRH